MRTIVILEMLRWVGKASVIAYMVGSVATILYMSSQSSSTFLAGVLNVSVRGSNMEFSESPQFYGTLATPTASPAPPAKRLFPEPENDTFFDQMKGRAALLSSEHQRKFLARKSQVDREFDPRARFRSKFDPYAAIIISDSFAFLHVWKCGGTTVAALNGDTQFSIGDASVQNRNWVAFVRDPIDRFLSAWAECGERQYQGTIEFNGLEHHSVLNWLDGDYDFRLRAFLNEVKDFTFPEPWDSCHTHAHPQANFMTDAKGQIDSHIQMIGDLKELRPILEIAGFHGFSESVKGRDSSSSEVKSQHFPSRREWIKDHTMLELCQFYAMDYFLFDFEPPAICVQKGGPLARYQ